MSNAPQIRFKGFTDAWEQRKLGEIVERQKSYSLSRDVEMEGVSGYRYIHYGDIHKQIADLIVKDEQLPNIKHGDYLYLQQGDLVLADASEDYTGIAEPCVILHEPIEKIIAGLHTIALRPLQADSLYLYYLLHTEDFKKFGGNMGTGLKVFGITFSNLSLYETHIPSVPEQTAIGNFFRTLDGTITLHQRKLDGLRELKKGYLQQMFPQTGERVPWVRFGGFSGEWQERRLGELFTERSERGAEGELISVTINSGVVKANSLERKDNSSEDKSNYKKVYAGDIAYNSMRMWQGASGISNYSGILSPAYTVIIPNHNANAMFFSYVFKLSPMIQKFQASSQGLTSDTWNLKFPLLSKILVVTPCYQEQTAIGKFFLTIDNQITALFANVERLKELKKAYLQKMFI